MAKHLDHDIEDRLRELAADSHAIRAIAAMLEQQTARLSDAVLSCNLDTEADKWLLVQRRLELEGARKLRAGVVAYLTSLKKR